MIEMKRVLTIWKAGSLKIEDKNFLREKAKEVPIPLGGRDKEDVEVLVSSFLRRYDALGLAAPQIGIGKRIIVFRMRGFRNIEDYPIIENYEVLINPVITTRGGEEISAWEGCLSCPEIQAEKRRSEEIKVTAFNRNNKMVSRKYKGIVARIVQHEIDHLDGVLIIDGGVRLQIPPGKHLLFERLLKSCQLPDSIIS